MFSVAVRNGWHYEQLATGAVSRLQTHRPGKEKLFSPAERVALSYSEAVTIGRVNKRVEDVVRRHFTPPERVELAATAAAYVMVARFLEAMQVPSDK